MKAFKYDYMPLKEIGLGGILVEPTADLIRLQEELFEAIGKLWGRPVPVALSPSGPRPRSQTLTKPPRMLWQRTFPSIEESVTVHTSMSKPYG
jgi:hypothetical protein